jgi:hypothetical protein
MCDRNEVIRVLPRSGLSTERKGGPPQQGRGQGQTVSQSVAVTKTVTVERHADPIMARRDVGRGRSIRAPLLTPAHRGSY